ncbi:MULTISPECIES: DUF7534 family protein [Halomicrobium]|uniref:Uncharacterized protein n=2 Tax=Halomicrobium mukohataei TaxID=57705 RepID=C7P225_HALMD|nr:MULTISPECIES: hypothetical protein [Halomicrobium]ACV47254.1 hypothetical protein Hmuk_1128 [Halomicrobium mukohataei DSM 12286]QCD65727.1 hypothetical protein E5139_08815 [Halomicrobium mukohataei]QFR20532.1 hypothetical protein GBQ70_08810 [Halomicrobium sp. ZPS1]
MAVEPPVLALLPTDLSLALVAALGLAPPLCLVALLGYWLYRDAEAHGTRAPILLVPLALFAPFGPLLYLYARRDWERTRTKTERDRRVETVLVALGTAFVLGMILTPPDPVTQAIALPVLTLVALPVAYFFVYRDGWARVRSAL